MHSFHQQLSATHCAFITETCKVVIEIPFHVSQQEKNSKSQINRSSFILLRDNEDQVWLE